MNLEADQAVQEARFAGACQDQHAGRPAPNLGWPGERKSIVQQAEASVVSRNETNQGYGAWGPASQGLGAQGLGPVGAGASRASGSPGPRGLQGLGASGPPIKGRRGETARGGGGWREAVPPLPPPAVREKRRGFSPSPLLKPSNTPRMYIGAPQEVKSGRLG